MGFLRKAVDDIKTALDNGQPERAAEIYWHAQHEGPGTPTENAAEINRIAQKNPRNGK